MSKKSRNASAAAVAAPPAPASSGRRGLLIGGGAALAVAAVIGGFVVLDQRSRAAELAALAQRPELKSDHAPMLGRADARVHIVEFLDPACETCAMFYPVVKRLLAEQPERLRLSVRHVALHKGSDQVVAMLEASRKQDKYWQTLEALLASQSSWTINHTVHAERARQIVERVGLDMARLETDMQDPEIARRMARDRDDAARLQVEKTPEYFVNGRQMASFGRQQLLDLVADAVKVAYR